MLQTCTKLLFTYLAIRLAFGIILIALKWALYFLHYLMCHIESAFDKGIQFQLSHRYDVSSDMSRLWLMKLKYICRTAGEKILDLWAGIRNPTPLSVTHLSMILLTWSFASSKTMIAVITLLYGCIKQIDYEPYRKPAITIVFIPAAFMSFQYLLFRMKYHKVMIEILRELHSILDHTRENIKTLDAHHIPIFVNNITDQITDRIGYTYHDKKLIRENYGTSSTVKSLHIEPVFKPYRKLIQTIREIRFSDGCHSFLKVPDKNLCFSYDRWKEHWLFEQMEPASHQELINYFREGHAQIYAKLYTDLRIIREDKLILLGQMEAKAEGVLQRLEEGFKEYRSDNCMLEYRLTGYCTYLDRMFNHNIIVTIVSVTFYLIKQYLKGIWAFIY